MLVLLDTGSPTTFVNRSVVSELKLETYSAPPFTFYGAVSAETATSSVATSIVMSIENIKYKFDAYVTAAVSQKIIIGDPVLRSYPKLLHLRETVEPENVLVPYDSILPIDYVDNPSRYFKEEDEIFVISVSESPKKDCNTFELLPKSLRLKYKSTVSNELCPSKIQDRKVEHEIVLAPDGRLPRISPYRLTPKNESIVNDLINDLLEKNFITPSKSPCSSPIVLVKKKDNSYRMCVDYRKLNAITVKDPFPLPRIDSLLSRIGKATIFSTLDLHSGYHQIPVRSEDQYKTAFVTPTAKYEYKVMPFGLVNAPSTFARYMAELFRDLVFVGVYLDDILVFSKSKEEHLNHLDVVLDRLKSEGLIAKLKKCHFLQSSVEFLGYQISAGKIEPLQGKTDAICAFPTPRSVKEAQRFLGMVNYYRRFIKGCSIIARPINTFISGEATWGVTQDKALKSLKRALQEQPVLIPFDVTASYRLTTDACKYGVGAVLEELDENKNPVGTVSYFSKSLQGAQQRYPAGELELLGIISALEHFKYLLHGKRFVLRTDHISLLSLKTTKEPGTRIARWLDTLSEYDFELQYVKGHDNVVADAISRAPYEINVIDELVSIDPCEWKNDYEEDPYCAALLVSLNPDEYLGKIRVSKADTSYFNKIIKRYRLSNAFRKMIRLEEDLLYWKDRYIVPRSKVQLVLNTYHDHGLFGGHFGYNVTLQKVTESYYWPRQDHEVQKYVASCPNCQVFKFHRNRQYGLLKPLEVPEGRWTDISIDFVSGLPPTVSGKDMILVVVDRFSKRAHFVACNKELSQEYTINLLFQFVFCYHGFPKRIVSDRDVRFTGNAYRELTERLGIKLCMSSSNHPESDGQSERTIKTLTQLLRSYAGLEQGRWDVLLPQVEFVYNSTYHSAVKAAPFLVDLGYVPNEPLLDSTSLTAARNFSAVDLIQSLRAITLRTKDFLKENQVNMEVAVNPGRREEKFAVGDYVLVHRDAYFTGGRYIKLQPIFLGPFKIVKVINENAYEVDLPKTSKKHRVINVRWIKKYQFDSERYVKELPRSETELRNRLENISSVIGFAPSEGIVYCKFAHVDPRLTAAVPLKMFKSLPLLRRRSLINNFEQLYKQSVSDERGEDVIR
ncbi:related to Transposon Ty3-G Gag-Pol polyprotein [Saccharomycodes ludwigii]|uniref:RNA-directed DNA polymerase n=1 Tax=Saccharomycodes ludwigii TaxID=36035 RepID=A0A376BAN3_9ASCO|nr:related to Transposon Ty3-G Gag-Pol polyprotein [Saccharomycodes ludwigii]